MVRGGRGREGLRSLHGWAAAQATAGDEGPGSKQPVLQRAFQTPEPWLSCSGVAVSLISWCTLIAGSDLAGSLLFTCISRSRHMGLNLAQESLAPSCREETWTWEKAVGKHGKSSARADGAATKNRGAGWAQREGVGTARMQEPRSPDLTLSHQRTLNKSPTPTGPQFPHLKK